ncbi:hypothetical protein [Xanthobacter versatilis]|uniref:hypothetical protein n=1 Tax=Xanthobacter autotrophicus (strain ATCC BAA-1158 / Py2) TaxID=78245 RepID=UPI003729118B
MNAESRSIPEQVTIHHVLAAVQELYGVEGLDKVTGRAIERAGYTLPGSAHVLPIAQGVGRCPICAEPFHMGDICATDIEMSTCHAACLEGTPVVELETGEEIDAPISTFSREPDPALPPMPTAPEQLPMEVLLQERDAFIVSKALWDEFVATLPAGPVRARIAEIVGEAGDGDPIPG